MGASGRWFKSLLSLRKTSTSTTHQEKGSESSKSKKKWKLWRSSSDGSMKKNVSDSSSLNAAVAVVIRAPPKDFMLIKQEWAAIRIQAVFRAFLKGWCDIPGTVDEVKAKLRMRQEGAIKRDRAMAYSLSTQQSRLCASPSSKATKAMTPLKHHNVDNKSLGCSLLERWMATKPWESPISRRNEDLVPPLQSRRNGVTTRISVKPLTTCESTPTSSSAISSEYLCDDSPVSTSNTSESPSVPSTNTVIVEATEERDVIHQPSYMTLTESTKAKLKGCRSSSQNSKRLVMEDCVSHSTITGFLNGDNRSSSSSDPSVHLWKDLCATPLRASYQKRQIGR
ncbi:hypothetical protein RJT34_28294 [Clitoria ternatea]|uniref:DUF4005 domain-containing protein n=1 Tax=Clitoria ternatea TaxID=43366 RepID=A0AAN9FD72_CLITE